MVITATVMESNLERYLDLAASEEARLSYIITRDERDGRGGEVPVISPRDYLARLVSG